MKRYAAAPRHVGETIPISLPTSDLESVAAIPELVERSDSEDALDSLLSISSISTELGFGRIPNAQQADN